MGKRSHGRRLMWRCRRHETRAKGGWCPHGGDKRSDFRNLVFAFFWCLSDFTFTSFLLSFAFKHLSFPGVIPMITSLLLRCRTAMDHKPPAARESQLHDPHHPLRWKAPSPKALLRRHGPISHGSTEGRRFDTQPPTTTLQALLPM